MQLAPSGRTFVATQDIAEDHASVIISVPLKLLMFASNATACPVFGAAFDQIEKVSDKTERYSLGLVRVAHDCNGIAFRGLAGTYRGNQSAFE
eukprot:4423673-Pyramimonas_sp.AAC.1